MAPKKRKDSTPEGGAAKKRKAGEGGKGEKKAPKAKENGTAAAAPAPAPAPAPATELTAGVPSATTAQLPKEKEKEPAEKANDQPKELEKEPVYVYIALVTRADWKCRTQTDIIAVCQTREAAEKAVVTWVQDTKAEREEEEDHEKKEDAKEEEAEEEEDLTYRGAMDLVEDWNCESRRTPQTVEIVKAELEPL